MLEIKNLTKTLGEKIILKNISLHVKKGESLAITGPNGAGKSTFIKCTVGLLKPSHGEIFIGGKKVKKNAIEAKKKIGFLGHESFLYDHLTPMENLTFYGKLYKVKNVEEQAKELLKKVGLYLFKDVPVRSFSRGMTQRLAIAKVLLPNPDILLFDEPHTGLDQEAITLLNNIIREKKREGTAILFISHDFDHVHALADQVVVLKKGRIVDTKEIFPQTDLSTVKEWYEKAVAEG